MRHGGLSSPMPSLGNDKMIFIGLDLAGQLQAQEINQVVAREEVGGIAQGKALLSQEYQRHHDEAM
jgi:hypothetical protein